MIASIYHFYVCNNLQIYYQSLSSIIQVFIIILSQVLLLFIIIFEYDFIDFISFLPYSYLKCSFSLNFVDVKFVQDPIIRFHFFYLKGSLFEAMDSKELHIRLVLIIFAILQHIFEFVTELQEPFKEVDYFSFKDLSFFKVRKDLVNYFHYIKE